MIGVVCDDKCMELNAKLNDALKEIDRLRSLLDEKDRVIDALKEELNEFNECYESMENRNGEI